MRGRRIGPCLPLYAGGIAWTLVYDTIYAHQVSPLYYELSLVFPSLSLQSPRPTFSEARFKGSAAQLQVEPFGLGLTHVGQLANKPEHLHGIVDFLLLVRHVHSLSLVSEGGFCQSGFLRRPSRAQPVDCARLRSVRGQRFLVFFVVSCPFLFPPASRF